MRDRQDRLDTSWRSKYVVVDRLIIARRSFWTVPVVGHIRLLSEFKQHPVNVARSIDLML